MSTDFKTPPPSRGRTYSAPVAPNFAHKPKLIVHAPVDEKCRAGTSDIEKTVDQVSDKKEDEIPDQRAFATFKTQNIAPHSVDRAEKYKNILPPHHCEKRVLLEKSSYRLIRNTTVVVSLLSIFSGVAFFLGPVGFFVGLLAMMAGFFTTFYTINKLEECYKQAEQDKPNKTTDFFKIGVSSVIGTIFSSSVIGSYILNLATIVGTIASIGIGVATAGIGAIFFAIALFKLSQLTKEYEVKLTYNEKLLKNFDDLIDSENENLFREKLKTLNETTPDFVNREIENLNYGKDILLGCTFLTYLFFKINHLADENEEEYILNRLTKFAKIILDEYNACPINMTFITKKILSADDKHEFNETVGLVTNAESKPEDAPGFKTPFCIINEKLIERIKAFNYENKEQPCELQKLLTASAKSEIDAEVTKDKLEKEREIIRKFYSQRYINTNSLHINKMHCVPVIDSKSYGLEEIINIYGTLLREVEKKLKFYPSFENFKYTLFSIARKLCNYRYASMEALAILAIDLIKGQKYLQNLDTFISKNLPDEVDEFRKTKNILFEYHEQFLKFIDTQLELSTPQPQT